MSLIGTFKRVGKDLVGEIFTLNVQVQNVRIVKEEKPTSDEAPTHRIFVGRAEIGAGWTKKANGSEREYLSVKLDDPSFPQAIQASLFDEDDGGFNLIWSRPRAAAAVA